MGYFQMHPVPMKRYHQMGQCGILGIMKFTLSHKFIIWHKVNGFAIVRKFIEEEESSTVKNVKKMTSIILLYSSSGTHIITVNLIL